ncbi:MAG: transketolase [Nostocoides sp.]
MSPSPGPSAPRSSIAARPPGLAQPLARKAGWTAADVRAVDTARLLAADAVQKAGNGHPGTAMSLAPVAYLLYQNVMRHDPGDPTWLGRDRFVLSCGHSSLTQYVQLFLSGYGLDLDDLRALRTWGSLTPGHPEVHHTPGVEITTGPLGSGLASAVGMAMAQRRQRGLLDPDTTPGASPFDHHIWVLASDGDIEEGVTHEASALAGHQELANLTVIYDQNTISIEDKTQISFSEDVQARYAAYGWEVVTVDWRASGDHDAYVEDIDALYAALIRSRLSAKPTLVVLRTVIAWPAPSKQDTGASHGSALGDAEIAATKQLLGFDPMKTFTVERPVLTHARAVKKRGKAAHTAWAKSYAAWRKANPDRAELLDRLVEQKLPTGLSRALPSFPADEKGMATRAASGKVLTALAEVMPELWGGSADLAESNNTTMAGQPSFIPEGKQTREWSGGPYGRTLHFGIREFGMGLILNGIALEGLTRPYGGTFLVFSDYMRGAVRLAALQQLPVTFVWTHDSIGLGEDGPTHQPVEHVAMMRATPNYLVFRPADTVETAEAWELALQATNKPSVLALTRQNLPTVRTTHTNKNLTAQGAYVLAEATGKRQAILMATGSEVEIALKAREALEAQGIGTRVVSMPCWELFAAQPESYRKKVLPAGPVRVAVEAGVRQGWDRWLLGERGREQKAGFVGMDSFGASAPAERLYEEFGITAEAVAAKAKALLGA